MKKLLLGLCALTLLFSCSDEQQDINEIEAFDITKVAALSAASPEAAFDATPFGLYRGIFVSADTKYHGEIVVAINEVDTPLALVVLDNGKQLYFKGQLMDGTLYRFKAAEAFFTIDIEDQNNVVVTSSDLGNRPIHIRLVKDDASSRAAVNLGTFVDNLDAGFAGTWDFISTSTSVINIPIPIPPFNIAVTVSNIDEAVICYDNGTPEGRMFNDTSQEPFTSAGCSLFPGGTFSPFFSGEQTLVLPIVGPTPIDEYAAFNQTTDILGNTLTWSIGSSIQAATPGVQTYVDLSCNVTTSGTWSWNGRSGIILLN